MIAGSIGRRYAKALLSIGIESQSYDALGRELDRAAETIATSPELKSALLILASTSGVSGAAEVTTARARPACSSTSSR